MDRTDEYRIEVIAEDELCPADGTCFIAGRVPARPGMVQVVFKATADPELIAAYRHKIGPGELLGELTEDEARGVGRA